METASLRLKFTPLLTNARIDEANCCLEIVPEVTCAQNFDKISWKQDNELVEYTIPLTYKIVIKKREKLKESTENMENKLEKTYYSCVDLTTSSSSSMRFFLSSCARDVTKMISDTYTLNKISPKNFYCQSLTDMTKKSFTEIQLNTAEPIVENKLKNRNVGPEELQEIVSLDRSYIKDNASEVIATFAEDEIGDHAFIDKVTSTDKRTHSVETLTDICCKPIKNEEPIKKLSLTPICSIDTSNYRTPIASNKPPITYVVNHFIECGASDFVNVAPRLPTRNKKQYDLRSVYNWDDQPTDICATRKRELPEVRVANFIKKMETEIMPLKMLLNEIILKCSTLNLPKPHCETKHGNVLLYKALSPKDKVEKKYKSKDLTKPNRVVYSIVFDG